MSIHRSGALTALEKEPGSLLGFVDPVFQQACGRDIPCVVAERMNLAHASRQACVVLAEFSDHVEWRDVCGIVVRDALKTRDMPD
jgi:hypothetical protein